MQKPVGRLVIGGVCLGVFLLCLKPIANAAIHGSYVAYLTLFG